MEFIDGTIRVPTRRKFKTVVTSSAEYPLDKTYYQTIKGMVTPMDILSPEARSSSLRPARKASVRRNFETPSAV
jgi:hypothetical protein